MKKKMMGITAFTVLVLSACSTTSPTTDSGQQEEQGAGAVAQEIQVSTAGALSTLDSGQYTDVNSSDMIGQLAEGLYRLDQEGDPELAMAAEEPTVQKMDWFIPSPFVMQNGAMAILLQRMILSTPFNMLPIQRTVLAAAIKWMC